MEDKKGFQYKKIQVTLTTGVYQSALIHNMRLYIKKNCNNITLGDF